MRLSPLDWLLLLLLAALWSTSFFFSKLALQGMPPLTLVLGRFGLAALILLPVLRLRRERLPRDPRVRGAFLAMGALNNLVPYSLFSWGQTQIASGLASILNATTPLFTILVAHALTRDERMTPAKLAGLLMGIAGVAIMLAPDLGAGGGGVRGELACLGGAFSYALAGVYGRRFRALGFSPVLAAAGQVGAAALLVAPLELLADRPWSLPAPGLAACAAVLTSALFCTAIAYILYFRILASAGATNLLLVTLLMPVGAVLLGALALHERLASRDFLGMALIGLGLAVMDGRAIAVLRRRPVTVDGRKKIASS